MCLKSWLDTLHNNLSMNLKIVQYVRLRLDPCKVTLIFLAEHGGLVVENRTVARCPAVIKLKIKPSMNFQLLIYAEIDKISGKFRFKPQNLVIYPAHKC